MRAEQDSRHSRSIATSQSVVYTGIGDEAGRCLDDQLLALDRLGWQTIELRTIDGVAIADLDDRAFAAVAEALSERGFAVACVASAIGSWARPVTGPFSRDLEELEVLAGRCRELATRYVRVMSYANDGLADEDWGARAIARLRELSHRAADAGLILLHENCTGWAGTDPERMLALLHAVDSPALGLLFDTGNGVEYGYDAYEVLVQVADRVRHVHVKDATGSAEDPVYTLPGTGQVRVADCLRLLLDAGYAGSWSIEPHLSLRPHEPTQLGDIAADRFDGFVSCGVALERLVAEQVLSWASLWRAAPGALVKAPAA